MRNPEIEELQNNEKYEQVQVFEHQYVKDFVISHLSSGGRYILWYSYYQIVMVITGLFFMGRAVAGAINGNFQPLIAVIVALVFSFTALILIHELLHALAFKLTGAPKFSIGSNLKKFIFYAEADRHVLNRSQFTLVALTPLVTVKLVTLGGIILNFENPVVYFWILVMSIHSLFCAGDIGMLDYFYKFRGSKLFTFDIKTEKKSYFYRERQSRPEN